MCVRDIASRMIEKNSNVPRIIDRLEIKKLVERTTSQLDKRETVITITKAGIALLQASTFVLDEKMVNQFILPEDEAVTLNLLLEKIRETTS
jgi:DNA-binding MarR family transcriptional regulator